MTVKHLSVEYNKVNERGTFSPGDVISGRVTVVTNKETKVQCFLVRAKGKAEVTWCEQAGQTTYGLTVVPKKSQSSEIIGPGRNVYPFTFVIPNMCVCLSNLTLCMEFIFNLNTSLLQQCATSISFYGSGKVTMNVTSEKMGVKQGEAVGVSVEVLNDSARTVTPRFYLCEKQTFVAQSKRTIYTNDILFGTGDSVPAETSRTITKVLSIPPQLPPTFFNCCMMKLEYRLKVLKITLDVPLARDPEIKLPLVILLGSPKPHQQKPKRSIWFRKLPG
uniref:Arrestin C-terminal-like domain-containing protein n=1 Tax=Lates calcarifer TaxID=8187 RepID=A0A4W6G7Z3_LATCA